MLTVAMLTALVLPPDDARGQTGEQSGPVGDASAAGVPPDSTVMENGAVHVLPAATVTARRVQERIKDIPFGLDVVDGEEIEARRWQTLEDALRATPGVNVWSDGSPDSANILIRGTGSINPVSIDDGSVALNVDGVPMSMRDVSLGTLDVERIEVLKGPQGTLFGNNSRAGAVNVTTNKPTRHLEGHVRAEYGQDQQHLEEAVLSGPLSDAWSGRIAVRNSGSNHWVTNGQDGQPLSRPGSLMYRASLLWQGAPGTNALFVAEQAAIKRTPALTVLRPYGDRPVVEVTPGIFDQNDKVVRRYSATIDRDLAAGHLTSITAYSSTTNDYVGGYDALTMQALGGPPVQSLYRNKLDGHTVSQDLRWSSQSGAPVFWVTGASLSHTGRTADTFYLSNGFEADRRYKTDSYGVYGEATYPLGAVLKMTGGLRHSWDRKSYDAVYQQTVRDQRALRDDYSTGRLALSYAVSPTTNLYGVVSRGYEPGGIGDYPTQIADSTPYKPAVSNAAEIGFKTESANRRFSLNGAVFMTRVRDDHLLGFELDNFSTVTLNANTRSRGAELQGAWRLGNGFELSGGLSYTDASITGDVLGAFGGDIRQGNRVPDVPRWSASLSVSYLRKLPGFEGPASPVLNVRADYQYVGSRAADAQNRFDLGRYRKVDLRVGVIRGNTEVYAFGSNLLDDRIDLYGYAASTTVFIGAPARGRIVGIGLKQSL